MDPEILVSAKFRRNLTLLLRFRPRNFELPKGFGVSKPFKRKKKFLETFDFNDKNRNVLFLRRDFRKNYAEIVNSFINF